MDATDALAQQTAEKLFEYIFGGTQAQANRALGAEILGAIHELQRGTSSSRIVPRAHALTIEAPASEPPAPHVVPRKR